MCTSIIQNTYPNTVGGGGGFVEYLFTLCKLPQKLKIKASPPSITIFVYLMYETFLDHYVLWCTFGSTTAMFM